MCAGDTVIPLAALADALPRLVMKKTKIDLTPDLRGPALAAGIERIARAFPAATASRRDGLRLDWEEGWLLIRGSNTEPIVRIVAEASDEATVDDAIARATAALRG
jgi:phosphomannomutase